MRLLLFQTCMVILFAAVCGFADEPAQPFDLEKAQKAALIDDPETATSAYLDSVPEERRTKTKAYAHGNYVLHVVDFLFSTAVMTALLGLGLSARMRDTAKRLTRFRLVQTALYWIQFLILTSVVSFPLTIYNSYYREKAYGLLTQTFGDWVLDQVKGLAVGCILGSLLFIFLYGVLRRTPRTWWIWGSVVMMAFMIFIVAVAPVFIAPIFNKFTPVQNVEIRESVLSMARHYGIPADEVYEMDASRRTDRISAYVNGMLGTMRIVIFDNTLRRCTPEEIQLIMGHEMGHYVLNHIWKGVVFFGLLILLGFLFVRWAFAFTVGRYPSIRIDGISDVAGLPLLVLLLSAFMFVFSPVTNTWSRVIEDEADDFGLKAGGQADAAATTFLKLGEYRDLTPHPIVETLFYDHPSGRSRIRNAMRWKHANHISTTD